MMEIPAGRLIATVLILMRVSSFFMGFPLLNTSLVPLNVKLLLSLALSFYASNLLGLSVPPENLTLFGFLLMSIKEIAIGFCIGLAAAVFTAAFSYAAEIVSYSMGLTVVNMFDPTFGMISVLDKFFIIVFYLVFFITGAYRIVIGSALMSFKLIPLTPSGFDIGNLAPFIVKISSLIFILAFKIAFPFMLTLFIVNLGLALINRLIPQINVFIVGLPLQIFVGLAALSIGFSAILYSGISLAERMETVQVEILKGLSE